MRNPIYPDLKTMRNINIQHINPDTIPDIREINIENDKPLFERVSEYIKQTKNPYFIRSGKILMKIEHDETEATIEDCMEGYFRSLI